MIAVLSYPKGIGKHIVCIYSGTVKSAIQTKIGDIPETPYVASLSHKNRSFYADEGF